LKELDRRRRLAIGISKKDFSQAGDIARMKGLEGGIHAALIFQVPSGFNLFSDLAILP
jgi:hypothetical protein